MKNDDLIKSMIRAKELKSANKSSSKKQFANKLSTNKFTPVNLTNTFTSNFENLKILNSDKKDNLNFSSNKINDKNFMSNYNTLNYSNNNKPIGNIKRKKIELISKSPTPSRNDFNSNKKCKSTTKLTKINSETKFLNNNKTFNNYFTNDKNTNLYEGYPNNPHQNISNNSNTIKIENINNIQNYNSYHIFKKSNSSIKFNDINVKDFNLLNINTPNSQIDKLNKTQSTEPRNSKIKNNMYNINPDEEINVFGDSNPVKVIVRFRPMNNVENVKLVYF